VIFPGIWEKLKIKMLATSMSAAKRRIFVTKVPGNGGTGN
jgi:hypothetical protein